METIDKVQTEIPQFNLPFQGHYLDSEYGSMRAFFPSKSGKFLLSVVGGKTNYCEPRELCQDPKEYSALELAIFDAVNGGWASAGALKEAGAFDVIGMGEYSLTTQDFNEEADEYEAERPKTEEELAQPSCAVFGWVPVEDIRKLWHAI